MMMVVVVPATREGTNIVGAITTRAHILQAVIAVLLGVMFVYMEIDVVVNCCIISHWVVCAARATRFSVPAQVLCGRCSGAFAYGRRVCRETRVTALGARCGVPALTAPLAARAPGGLPAMGALWWYHPRLVRGGGAGRSTASS